MNPYKSFRVYTVASGSKRVLASFTGVYAELDATRYAGQQFVRAYVESY